MKRYVSLTVARTRVTPYSEAPLPAYPVPAYPLTVTRYSLPVNYLGVRAAM